VSGFANSKEMNLSGLMQSAAFPLIFAKSIVASVMNQFLGVS
jgi:hypothetical protein